MARLFEFGVGRSARSDPWPRKGNKHELIPFTNTLTTREHATAPSCLEKGVTVKFNGHLQKAKLLVANRKLDRPLRAYCLNKTTLKLFLQW